MLSYDDARCRYTLLSRVAVTRLRCRYALLCAMRRVDIYAIWRLHSMRALVVAVVVFGMPIADARLRRIDTP